MGCMELQRDAGRRQETAMILLALQLFHLAPIDSLIAKASLVTVICGSPFIAIFLSILSWEREARRNSTRPR